jgi:signal transduction histidine kinase
MAMRMNSPSLRNLLVAAAPRGRTRSREAALRRTNAALERHNAELERANDEKSRFLATMSHELRTPLHSIIGFSELIHDGRVGPVSAEHRDYLEVVRASADHMLALIGDVLDLAQIESGHLRLDPEAVDPGAIAAECVRFVSPVAAAATVELELDAQPLGSVLLDPGRLRQVLLNYIANAVKFAGEGGHVHTRVGADQGELLIEVSDDGPGLDRDEQGRVFAEFVQLGRGRGHGRGTGLGLAITKLIVESQGGRVGVESRPGHGSTFSARLPLRAAPTPAPAETAPASLEPVGAVA